MKNKKHREPIQSATAPENDWIIQAMMSKMAQEDEQEKEQRKYNLKKKTAGIVLATSLLAGSALGIDSIIDDREKQNPTAETGYTQTIQETETPTREWSFELTPENPNVRLRETNGVMYYECTEDSILKLAQESMARVEKMLTNAGSSPVGASSGKFYPYYYDEYMLAGIAMTESTLRICAENGDPLVSKDGAIGLMQVMPDTVATINDWLKDTMDVQGVEYTVDDLNDPEKAMDISNLSLIWICKNYCREDCNNPLYQMMGREFSMDEQKDIMLATYEQGPGYMIQHINNKTVGNYLRHASNDNYLKKILRHENNFRQNYSENEQ